MCIRDRINIAKKKYSSLSDTISINVTNYDELKPSNNKYDWIFSIYSIYYTQDPKNLINNLYEHMKHGSKFVIIGPSSNNAVELDSINLSVTGKKRNIEDIKRMHRIEEDFNDIFLSIFGEDNTRLEFVDTKMSFPSAEEFATYYWSTLLWRESIVGFDEKEIKELKDQSINVINQMNEFVLNKQMSCLVGEK